jgi:hypothetical protein
MFWNYLRNKVRDAVLAGVADAAQELDGTNGDGEMGQAVALLRARLTPALPAPVATAPENGAAVAAGPARRRKAD